MTVAEASRCRCGTRMRLLLSPRGDYHACGNCDTLQVREVVGLQRIKTKEDVRFDLYWWSTMDREYGPLPSDVNTNDLYGR